MSTMKKGQQGDNDAKVFTAADEDHEDVNLVTIAFKKKKCYIYDVMGRKRKEKVKNLRKKRNEWEPYSTSTQACSALAFVTCRLFNGI